MYSPYFYILSLIGLFLSLWFLKKQAKDIFVFSTLSPYARPRVGKYFPSLLMQAARFLVEEPQQYIERSPVNILQALEAITSQMDADIQRRAAQAIVDNIRTVADTDEAAAARALLTVINVAEQGSMLQQRALMIRPDIINSLAETNPLQAVMLAQKGIISGEVDNEMSEKLNNQSCELALRHLKTAFYTEPVGAAHAACNIALKTTGQARESALWMLLSQTMNITSVDFESGHAAVEQVVLLSNVGSQLHGSAVAMWDWHMRQILAQDPEELIGKMFYGFGISKANAENKLDLYEHGFDYLLKNPIVIKAYSDKIVRVSLGIGLRTGQYTTLYQKAVDVWTAALKELCQRDLRAALQEASQAMTFTAPGSQFERQAQMACCYLKRMEDDIVGRAHMVFGEEYAH